MFGCKQTTTAHTHSLWKKKKNHTNMLYPESKQLKHKTMSVKKGANTLCEGKGKLNT